MEFRASLSTEYMPLFQSACAHIPKRSGEKSVASQLFWLRESCQRQNRRELEECIARDMSVDGHTKGAIDRDALMSMMNGLFEYKHTNRSSLQQIRKRDQNESDHINTVPTVSDH